MRSIDDVRRDWDWVTAKAVAVCQGVAKNEAWAKALAHEVHEKQVQLKAELAELLLTPPLDGAQPILQFADLVVRMERENRETLNLAIEALNKRPHPPIATPPTTGLVFGVSPEIAR